MYSKSLLIAVAAFALTTGGAHAYVGNKLLLRAGLSYEQVAALEEARVLRESGEVEKARDVLLEAGIDEEALAALRAASRAARVDIKAAVAANDFSAFEAAVAGTEIAQIIANEEAFLRLVAAYTHAAQGRHQAARVLLDELGVPALLLRGDGKPLRAHQHHERRGHYHQEAIQVALRANDPETARAIREEMGEE